MPPKEMQASEEVDSVVKTNQAMVARALIRSASHCCCVFRISVAALHLHQEQLGKTSQRRRSLVVSYSLVFRSFRLV